jgi:hypothetical protein
MSEAFVILVPETALLFPKILKSQNGAEIVSLERVEDLAGA